MRSVKNCLLVCVLRFAKNCSWALPVTVTRRSAPAPHPSSPPAGGYAALQQDCARSLALWAVWVAELPIAAVRRSARIIGALGSAMNNRIRTCDLTTQTANDAGLGELGGLGTIVIGFQSPPIVTLYDTLLHILLSERKTITLPKPPIASQPLEWTALFHWRSWRLRCQSQHPNRHENRPCFFSARCNKLVDTLRSAVMVSITPNKQEQRQCTQLLSKPETR